MIRQLMEQEIAKSTSTKEKLFNIGIMLFATKSYNGVGIREICREAGIKESSFYNHYKGKAALLEAILDRFVDQMEQAKYSEEEIKDMISRKDIDYFIEFNMQKFAASYGFPNIHPGLLIVFMERFTHEKAHEIMKTTPYHKWKEPTERILNGLIANGTIKEMDVPMFTMEYYFALSGIVDDFIQRVAWDEDFMPASIRIQEHMDYYKKILAK